MHDFWQLARTMGRYRGLLILAVLAATLDAATAFAGFGLLRVVIGQTFADPPVTMHDAVAEIVNNPDMPSWIPDLSGLVAWIPADLFWGFAISLLLVIPLTLFGSAMRFTHAALSYTVGLRSVMRIRQKAYFRMLHVPADQNDNIGAADRLSRLMSDTARLGTGFSTLMGRAVRDSLMGVVFLIWAMLIDWTLTSIFLLALPLVGIAMRKFGKKVRRASKYSLQQYAEMTQAAQESMQSPAVVRVHNAEGYERRRFNTINRAVLREEMKARTARALSSPVIELLALTGLIAVSLIAGWYVFRQQSAQPKDVFWVLAALGVAGASVKPLANLNNDLQDAGAAARRVNEILNAPVEPNLRGAFKDPQAGITLPRHHTSLAFDNVTYRYPKANDLALRGISLTLPYGCSAAVVGTNGSGKSTLLNLVPRLTCPTSGRVLIDGVDLATVRLRSLRDQISVVTQQTILFEGSISDNIAYGRRETPRADIVAAAQAAFAHDFITRLPEGYDTLLGEGGSGLSGGQRQRLCIARAILRDPAILIMDEATSQIDAESEAQIAAAVRTLRAGRTTLTIAHRLSTVVECDPIVVMNDGQIIDQGTHRELLERCDIYQVLVKNQMTG
ncbi:MAG: ABC transporter ATP-binding protein [Algisphaera sp.]